MILTKDKLDNMLKVNYNKENESKLNLKHNYKH